MILKNLKFSSICLSAFITLTISSLVWSDDTEIFFGNTNAAVRPNVMLILDTSSSMKSRDGGGLSRLDRMKVALRTIISGTNNINMGLMRFTDPGGPVLYPTTNIDQAMLDAADRGNVSARIIDGNDDAEQSSTGTVTLSNTELSLTTKATIISGGSVSIERRIAASSDDAEQRQNNSIYLTSTDLEFIRDRGDIQRVGLRFTNMAIPAGATIQSATIDFTVDEMQSGAINLEFSGELSDSGTFTTSSNNVGSRNRTAASVLWSIPDQLPPPVENDTITSADISSVVQEIVNNGAWVSNNAITLILEHDSGTGLRELESFDGESSQAPMLKITYSTGPLVLGTPTDQTIGLRFQTVLIPQGATITSAALSFTASTASTGRTSMTITGDDDDNSQAFAITNFDITSRSDTAAAVLWSDADDWPVADEVHSSPDLSAIVQEIVNRAGWCGGNAISFLIEGSALNTASRFPYSYDNSASNAPQLNVTYDPDSIPASGGCLSREYTARVSTGTDDAEESNTGGVSLTSTDLEMVDDGNNQTVGIRFGNLNLSQGATITNAYIEFTTDEITTTGTSLTIRGQAANNADTFSSARRDISTRLTTSASVPWNSISSWSTEGAINTTPDLTNIVQEIVNRTGWTSSSNMAFIITGTGKRVAESYEGSASQAPRLVVWAESSGASSGATRTVRDELLDQIDGIQYKGSTPIVGTLYEGALYYRGEDVDFGRNRGTLGASRREHARVSHPDSYTGGTLVQPNGCSDQNLSSTSCIGENITGTPTYITPIISSCQANHVVILSDGSPTANVAASKVKTMAGITSCADGGSAACGPELSSFLYLEDQSPLPGRQFITTNTIGFNFTGSWLKGIATAGGGEFYEATDSADLIQVFKEIIGGILQTDTTYVSPGVTVNSFNRLTHRNELYYSLFKPDGNPLWAGNLKRYRITSNADIVDADGILAIDEDTGFFKETARSFWSTSTDGSDVTLGGAAENLPAAASRKIYTYTSGSASTVLSNSNNAFSDSNVRISKALLGIETETNAYRTDLINWARGVDILDHDEDGNYSEDRNQLNDPLHSQPHLVTYGGTDANPDITVFYGDNTGFLHAVDADTGEEVFSFIPEVLLPNLETLYSNSSSDAHPYGIDGPVSSWVNDVDGDSIIEPSDGDHVYLYFGMRRGGRNYYALDVTDRDSPKMLWSIQGGNGDFVELGQTWSRPIKTKVKIDTTTYDVLIFAGGYDEDQDDVAVKTADDLGRAIYMVNASDGTLLWSAGDASSYNLDVADMDYSIPSSIRGIDVNSDGQVDQLYVGDMGGQLWRFDVNQGNPVSSLVTGGVIADIAGTGTSDNRRFYHAPDISIHVSNAVRKLAIAIGSGWQAHPLSSAVENRFYVMFSEDVIASPDGGLYTKYTESDFFDATDDILDTGNTTQQNAAQSDLNSKQGWYIALEQAGEKVLASSATANSIIYFTTYEPTPPVDSCNPGAGTPRLYRVNVADATATGDYNNSGSTDALTPEDRSTILQTVGLPPAPTHIKVQDPDGTTNDVLCVGTKCEKMDDNSSISKTYWYVED